MASDPAVADSLAKIRQYYSLGSHVPDTKYGAMGNEAVRLGLNIDYMRACRRFAELYTPDQLERLCEACEAGGYAIGWARVMLLLGVPSAAERNSLLKIAIKGQWSKSQLQAEIRRRYGRRAKEGAGRPTKIDSDGSPAGAYGKALELCSKFSSFMTSMRHEGPDGGYLLQTVPPLTRACIERAETAMIALQRVLDREVNETPAKIAAND
jgi:hypothetical protein